MIVTLKTEGGVAYFPGLQKTLMVDSSALTDTEKKRLEDLLRLSDFSNLPSTYGKQNPHAADARVHLLTVKKDSMNKTVKILEPVENVRLLEFMDFIREKAKI